MVRFLRLYWRHWRVCWRIPSWYLLVLCSLVAFPIHPVLGPVGYLLLVSALFTALDMRAGL